MLFDFDGVIVDTVDFVKDIFNEFAFTNNLPQIHTREDVGKFFDKNFFEAITELGFSKKQSLELLDWIKMNYIRDNTRITVFAGMANVLKKLSSRYTLVIISSNHSDAVGVPLKRYNLDTLFKDILGGEEKGNKVEKILYTIGKLSATNEDVYYIGDTVGDMVEGKTAGVKTIGVSWGYHNKAKLTKASPDHLFEEVKELEEYFID